MNKGDYVLLKSGGPMMLVENVREDKMIECIWFAGNEVKRDTFFEECLVRIY